MYIICTHPCSFSQKIHLQHPQCSRCQIYAMLISHRLAYNQPIKHPQEIKFQSYRLGNGPLPPPALALVIINGTMPFPPVTGVCAPFPAGVAGAGVGALLVTAERLCAIWALTRCPAASAALSDNSPASTAAAMILARRRALSPGFVGCAPRTPRRSSMADWGSRMVPPPMVPTSMEGMETEIWRLPLTAA